MYDNITLSHSQQQLIFGGLLGDGYFNKDRNFFRFYQSKKQEEYLLWKYSLFEELETSKIYERIHEQGYVGCSFEVKRNSNLHDLYSYIKHHLYSNSGRKKISLEYLSNIDEFGLAIWWMDDGSLCKHKGNRWGKLCTECFNYEEHILLQKYFKDKWGINVSIKQEKNKYYFIRFNVRALKRLFSLIYKYILHVPCMIYKIDMDYQNNVDLGEYEDAYKAIQEYKQKCKMV